LLQSATASAEQSSTPPVDLPAALEAVDGDAAILAELADVFLADSPHLLADLCRALQEGDAPHAARTAHSLKGALGTLRTTTAYALAQEIERLSRAGLLEHVHPIFARLESEMAHLATFWTAWRCTRSVGEAA
jgi:two-component system sensor histidine kinase/response regulator